MFVLCVLVHLSIAISVSVVYYSICVSVCVGSNAYAWTEKRVDADLFYLEHNF